MNKNINSKEIFSIGLGLCAPWFIENVAIDDENITNLYSTLGEAYRLKEIFLDIFKMADINDAKVCLELWCDSAVESNIEPFVRFVDLVKSHWNGITNYFNSKLTNGILEGINSKIQLAKRRARGYRNINNFINMIFFTCGKLNFDYPKI